MFCFRYNAMRYITFARDLPASVRRYLPSLYLGEPPARDLSSAKCRIGSSSSIPAAENLDLLGLAIDAIENLIMLRHNQPSNLGSLANCGVTLGKETQSFTSINDKTAELAGRVWIVFSNVLNDPFEVVAESLREYYFEVHSLIRARTSSPAYPPSDVESA